MLHCQLFQQRWKLQTLTSQSARMYPRIDLSTSCAPGPGLIPKGVSLNF